MEEKNWWKPQNLKKSEKEFLAVNDLSAINTGNDFGSYKLMRINGDVEKSEIRSHNDIAPSWRVKLLEKLIGNRSIKSICDIGCGLGYTANELKNRFPKSYVTGIEISEDAVEYAKKTFEHCEFLCAAVDPCNKKQTFKYDLITAFEFYPFTRTDSYQEHVDYINHLTKDFTKNEALVIYQLWNSEKSLYANYNKITKNLSHLDFKDFGLPIRIIGRYIPSYKFSMFLSNVARMIFRCLMKRKIGSNKIIIISKK